MALTLMEYRPTKVTLNLTELCNCDCRYCYSYHSSTNFLDIECAKSAIRFAFTNSVSSKKHFFLRYYGTGEPTIAWDLLTKTVEYTKSLSQKYNYTNYGIHICTNGVMCQSHAMWLANNMSGINLSFDILEEIQNIHRPAKNNNDTFDIVYKNAKVFSKYNNNTMFRTTITKHNVNRQVETLEYASKHFGGVPIIFQLLYKVGACSTKDIYPPDDINFIKKFIAAHRYFIKNKNVQLSYSELRDFPLENFEHHYLTLPFSVMPDGSIIANFGQSQNLEYKNVFKFGEWNPNNLKFQIDYEKMEKIKAICSKIFSECEFCSCNSYCYRDRSDIFIRKENNKLEFSLGKVGCKISREIGSYYNSILSNLKN
ncbi:MAG: hypothetical protein JW866_05830 [Ignavibacteriales bacterium]|nr:hypothetical protein [Ignavibacteriales bacterium]